jgi:hypothetical protein
MNYTPHPPALDPAFLSHQPPTTHTQNPSTRKRVREVEGSEGSPPARDSRRVNRRGRPSFSLGNQEIDIPNDDLMFGEDTDMGMDMNALTNHVATSTVQSDIPTFASFCSISDAARWMVGHRQCLLLSIALPKCKQGT